jgi:hypothetical protein
MSDSDRMYQRNQRHRALVSLANCVTVTDFINTGNSRAASIKALGCSLNFFQAVKD